MADALAKWSIGRANRIISSLNELNAMAKRPYRLDLMQTAAVRHVHRRNQFFLKKCFICFFFSVIIFDALKGEALSQFMRVIFVQGLC